MGMALQCPKAWSLPDLAKRASSAWRSPGNHTLCLSIAPVTNQQSRRALPVYNLQQDGAVSQASSAGRRLGDLSCLFPIYSQ